MNRLPSSPRTPTGERGTVLITVMLGVLMLGSLSFAFLQEGLAEKASVDMRMSSLFALQIAEKGAVESTMEIFAMADGSDDGIGTVSGEYAGGDYEVRVARNPDNPDRWTLTARGTYGLSTRRLQIGVRRRAGGDFVEGLFAKDTLTFSGRTQTDAYDSAAGSYASQAVNNDSGGSYAEGGGHLGSNTGIVLRGSAVTVRGNAIPGPTHQISMSGSPTVWGDMLPRKLEIEMEPASEAEFRAAMADNNNAELLPGGSGSSGGTSGGAAGGSLGGSSQGKGKGKSKGGGSSGGSSGASSGNASYDPTNYSIKATGQATLTLSGGTYFFTDVSLSGQTKMQVNGPTTLYITGDLDLTGGGFVNLTGRPADLKVFAHPYSIVPGHTPSSSTVKIRGGSGAAMVLWAPGASLSVHGNDDIYGAFVANTISVAGNTSFHYDKALGDIKSRSHVTIERLFWRDLDERVR